MTNLEVSISPENADVVVDELDEETSPTRTSPPSEASSQEWDKVSTPPPS